MAKTKVMQIHPLCRMFGSLAAMPDDQHAELVTDIKEHGIKVPILVNKKRDTILDGQTRWKIAYDLGITIPKEGFEVFTGKDSEIEGEILSRNLYRRQIDADQRVAIYTKLHLPRLEKEARERQSAAGSFKDKAKLNGKGSVAEQIAKGAGVSKRKADQAVKVAKGDSTMLDDVIHKKQKLHKAAKKAPTSKRKPRKEIPFADVVYKKWTQWLNRFPHEQRREVMKLVKGWIG